MRTDLEGLEVLQRRHQFMETSSPHGEHPDKEVMGSWKQFRSWEYEEQRLTRWGRTEEAREPRHCSAGVDSLAMEDSLPEPTPGSE